MNWHEDLQTAVNRVLLAVASAADAQIERVELDRGRGGVVLYRAAGHEPLRIIRVQRNGEKVTIIGDTLEVQNTDLTKKKALENWVGGGGVAARSRG